MVQRPSKPPWLLVTKPLGEVSDGFATESSNDSLDVTINGTVYFPLDGQCIVVFESMEGKKRHVHEIASNDSFRRLADGLSNLTVREIDTLLESQEKAGQ